MIKRTGEHVLTWIGVGLQTIGVLFFTFFAFVIGANPEEIQEDMVSDGSYTYEEAEGVIAVFRFFFGFGIFLGVILLVVAIVAGILISKKVKLAGILLLVAGILSLFVSFASILWIIAGIMLLVRKPKTSAENHQYYHNYEERNTTTEYPHNVENHNPQRHEHNQNQHFETQEEAQRSKEIQKDPYKY